MMYKFPFLLTKIMFPQHISWQALSSFWWYHRSTPPYPATRPSRWDGMRTPSLQVLSPKAWLLLGAGEAHKYKEKERKMVRSSNFCDMDVYAVTMSFTAMDVTTSLISATAWTEPRNLCVTSLATALHCTGKTFENSPSHVLHGGGEEEDVFCDIQENS